MQDLPVGRWPVELGLHPQRNKPGFAYTFAGGYLDDPFGFDPAAFGISPREAQQIDPQQRLLLEVVWEALEDAGVPPSSTARQAVGVYVGASNVDYQNGASGDPSAIESHFMTGNSLSIVSNRVSYIFDWRGPSFTVDSACSSSLVALAQASAALKSGEIDIAVVAGVNLLLSPAPYIGFSRASMLSPTGRCRPFSAGADGYVRSEGAIAIVLKRSPDARVAGNRIHAEVVAAQVNSDGRTSGISLPSAAGQGELIKATYAPLDISLDALAFVEAHGTGTPVGDPIEAQAIGSALGGGRGTPLTVGSVKSNIGHLECVSGLAGLLKTTLALKHGLYPRTLYLDELNPNIPFEMLNLAPACADLAFDVAATPYAGICNYGFGGTNAHVVLRAAEGQAPAAAPAVAPRLLTLSAKSQEALKALAGAYAAQLAAADADASAIGGAAHYQRDLLEQRLALPLESAEAMSSALHRFATGEGDDLSLASGKAAAGCGKVAFIYSGNGAQWVGMGRTALARNAAFRARFEEADRCYLKEGGWSLLEALQADDLASRIEKTSVAQPLIFAIQAALTTALAEEGIVPDLVLGHSVGEVAAALASGALDFEAAIHLIHHRSLRQETVAGQGRMLVLAASEEQASQFLGDLGAAELDIAAVNGPRSVTLSGSVEAIAQAEKAARAQRIATVNIGVDYPFHSPLLDEAKDGILDDLQALTPGETQIDFVSTVTGSVLPGTALDALYWWRNIRQPVRFADAIATAGQLGATHFIEIGPRPILTSVATETLRQAGLSAECLGSLSERDDQSALDPVRAVAARAFVRGVRMDEAEVFGPAPAAILDLPHYPWQHQRFVLPSTSEALELYGQMFGGESSHPLLGRRVSQRVPEWRSFVDDEIVPYLADHKVEGEVIVPGAALAEMMLAVGRETYGAVPLELRDFDILRPLSLSDGAMREVSTRFDAPTQTCEIWARRRLSGTDFLLHAIGRVAPATGTPIRLQLPDPAQITRATKADVYAAAARCGLDYGPSFRKVEAVERDGDSGFAPLSGGPLSIGLFADDHLIDPTQLDASLHGLFLDAHVVEGETRTNLPVRIAQLRLWQPGVAVHEAITRRAHESRFTSSVDITLLAQDGSVVADVTGLVLHEVVLSRRDDDQRQFRTELEPLRGAPSVAAAPVLAAGDHVPMDAVLLLRGFVRSFLYETVQGLAEEEALVPARLIAEGRIAAESADRLGLLMAHLTALGVCEAEGEGWRLNATHLPAAQAIFRALVERCPDANGEIRLAAHLMAALPGALKRGEPWPLPANLTELFEEDGLIYRAPLAALAAAVEARIDALAPVKPHIVVIRPWTAGVLRALLPFARAGRARVTLAGADAAGYDRVASQAGSDGLGFFNTADPNARLAAVDLVLGLAADARFGDDPAALARLREAAAGAGVVVAHPVIDSAFDILLGGTDGVRVPERAQVEAIVADLGGTDLEAQPLADGLSAAVGAVLPPAEVAEAPLDAIAVLGGGPAETFARTLAGVGAVLFDRDALPDPATLGTPRAILMPIAFDAAETPRAGLTRALLELKRVLDWMEQDVKGIGPGITLWIVTAAGRPVPGEELDPAQVAVSGFCRVALNEHPEIDLRTLDVDAFDAAAAGRILAIAQGKARGGSLETERVSRPDGEFGIRVLRGVGVTRGGISETRRLRLDVPQAGALSTIQWVSDARKAPVGDEVEIEVAATGLNFRDVMLALGALDDEILGPGLTGASLGFECAGTVVRTGPEVRDLGVGDKVMGFAPDAFASHVTVPSWFAFKVPDGVAPEAAAAIPVAFATAWYALVDCARLKAGDSVLVHGAAGGVGLAAVEIALSRGARVIATAGTPEKAALLKALGVEAVYNSRDLAFAAEIMRDHGKVDVVLNSLAGEAMIASLRIVKPFGRFVELGKRDFLTNTSIGLRPFARNISYFGVDLDQLLAHDPERSKALMRDISDAFVSGALKPIPYRLVAGENVEEAFRQMQGARHIGKIVVSPPRSGRVRPAATPNLQLRDGVHLVVGGTGGFGFETAMWVAAQTSGVVAVASRSGVRDEAIAARIAAANAAGARIVVEKVDARDAAALSDLVERLVQAHGPLRGIYHTAMVLEDGVISNLTEESLATVLAPKLDGVIALDRITETHPVDQFVVYSSASAMIGSPGQGAYVAANAFLEGVVRNRRTRGLPGLAAAWGAVSDAGVIAKNQALGQRLARATGVAGISSKDGLEFLGRQLAKGDAAPVVNVYAQVNGSAIASQLAVLKTPTFPRLFSTSAQSGGDGGESLLERLEGKSDEEAQEILGEIIGREIATILRLPADAMDRNVVLSELGMDSLMALELRLTLEKEFGLELPLLAIGSGRTLADLTRVAVASLRGGESEVAAEEGGPVLAPADQDRMAKHGFKLEGSEALLEAIGETRDTTEKSSSEARAPEERTA